MSVKPSLEKLVTLLTYAERGALAIALYDDLAVRRETIAALRQGVARAVYDVTLNEHERNPIDLIRALRPQMGDVVNLFNLERAFPEVLGYLDLQREALVDLNVSVICWVTNYEHRELVNRAPNFYAFRTALFDFTTTDQPPITQHLLIGRKRELKQLREWLTARQSVVVTGPGGVGKTMLAQATAKHLREHFTGGVVWLDCETEPTFGEIIQTIVVALTGDAARHDLPDEQRRRAAAALRARPCLLILDNFETVADDTELLRWLKTVEPPSVLLITSRQSVAFLSTHRLELPEMSPKDAVELFDQRARAAGWDGADDEMVGNLCELAGHLPLAIELLAPRAAELPLKSLVEMVSKNLAASAAAPTATSEDSQRSITACFRLSFDRLSGMARQLLRRLSVAPIGVSEDLIAPLTNIENWQEPITECVRHSLLHYDGQRYIQHPLIRRFVFDQWARVLNIDVCALHDGDDRLYMYWAEIAHYEGVYYKIEEVKWRELIYSQVVPLKGKYRLPSEIFHSPVEVFLCLRGELLDNRYDRGLLGNLFSLAARHSWGAPNYLVVDDRIEARLWNSPDLRLHELRECLKLALESGVADLIETRFDRKGTDPIHGRLLRHGADRAEVRLTQARRMLADSAWKCYVPGGGSALQLLLDGFILSEAERQSAEKFITVLDRHPSADQLLFLKRARRAYPKAQQVVALRGPLSLRLDVYKYCQDKGLPVVQFGGAFELLYFLLRLEKESKRTIYSMNECAPEVGKVEIVEPQRSQVFNRDRASGAPLVLFTSCFDQEKDCIEASHDAGEIKRVMPLNADYRVCPSLESHQLPDLLQGMSRGALASADKAALAVWLYLGHGYKNRGLQSGGGKVENAEEWLKRFSGYRGALPLVFFAACRSDAVARKFAEAGAGVAIGFAGAVLPKACRLLAQPVILALLQAWEDRAALLPHVILDAYEKGCRDLIASDLDQAKPVAFYQKTEVRICR